MTLYRDVYFSSSDGLTLHARDYNDAPPGSLTILCLPGLTRNARDFERLAGRLAPIYRLLCAEQRGRGLSDRDPDPENYHPGIYLLDMMALLDHLAIARTAIIGSSYGGIMAMMIAARRPARCAGIFLNDVGPELMSLGLQKIQSAIDRRPKVSNWREAAGELKGLYGANFPLYGTAEWDRFARAVYREDDRGVPILDYDPAIALKAKEGPLIPPNLWPLFDSLPNVPLALLRGRLSTLLAEETVAEMVRRRPDLMVAELSYVGHPPSLDEPGALALIDRFLDAVRRR